MNAQKRRAPRVPLSTPICYRAPEGELLESTARNLSTLGLFIQTHEPLPEGTTLEMELGLRDGPLALKGIVRRARGAPFAAAGMGVAFIFEDESTEAVAQARIQVEMFEALGDALFSVVGDKSAPEDLP